MPSLTDNPKRLIDPDSVIIIADLKVEKYGSNHFHMIKTTELRRGHLMSIWGTIGSIEWYVPFRTKVRRAFIVIRHDDDPHVASIFADEVHITYEPQLTEKAIRTN